ncbi:hypothetical protein PHYSODRAFT_286546 [Phytophthora sojae]|uniref:HAT C-terminal dimerisation domain-containing protein n=1 Tax=Phytophthora sojae (strain P6497) TaxID=1094619 RepID=G4ZT83_PHYSP|nr:hypothetical protein PHYSODRAFT_286546 [Phytophthora sojae]EGZ13115.1 hypothetical protein PHYSODRAFT_286546 [Phytophthora sojae]|eukprot:XP_009530544.1 hypothetical protein PHYSODRAFT_286546 [Phytophthora sojae]
MVELRHENNFAELKKHTDLHPIKRNVMRWSSTFTMLERYIRIRSEIKKVEAVEELIPTGGKHRKLVVLFEHLKKFESICKRLQREDTDMAEVRAPQDVLHTPAFETGVVKVIAGAALSQSETAALKRFEVKGPAGKKRKEREEDYASSLLRGKGKKEKQTAGATSYMPLVKMIPPTSNTCKLLLTPQRRAILPANFEQLAFLRVNRPMWDVTTVASVSAEETL